MKKSDLTGKKFGRLTVLCETEPHITSGGHPQVRWMCACECGKRTVIKAGHLRSGNTKSCGCLGPESSRALCLSRSTHGMRNHWLYKSWQGLIKRCENPNDPAYRNYGGRGIGVCDGIRSSPKTLLAVLGERPVGEFPSGRPEWTIDREDNDGGYWCGACKECLSLDRPLNIRWATALQQNRNSRNIVPVTIAGTTKCLTEWAGDIGITQRSLARRISIGVIGTQLLTKPFSGNRF